ncbi:TPA: carboxylating nicotinate-nucleotide diphosphorylase [Candidatus Poribacteria bacterium]|nr:carboxylating nicotinate-nucleotide diphosphorylase [Candidatus Poribacteria bacterium]
MRLDSIEIIRLALDEDIFTGDITSESMIPDDVMAKASFLSKDNGIVAGLDVVKAVFHKVDQEIVFNKLVTDGTEIYKGQIIAIAEGRAKSLLSAERTALNFLQRLSGIATNTSRYVKAVSGYKAVIVDTRKTTPGWRVLEKYAVRVGGGHNHRFGLYDAVLIKDNHIAVVGSIAKAVAMAREKIPHTMKIEVETENLDQVAEAIESGVDIIMLDNMSLDMMSEAVKLIDGRALVEASGGVKLENVTDIAKTGVDLISIGALTHSAMPLDISMEMELKTEY